MIEYKSCFAKSMQDMVDYRVSLGYIAASYENRLKRLDTFIAENYPSEATLTKQMVLHYVSQQDSDKASVRQNKALIIRLFAEYLISTGKDAYVLPRNYISNSKSSFSPHIFTDRELTDLFHMVDHLPETEDILRRCTAAVLLRLIYTCGLRPGEGLRLKRKNVNLDTGEILITETKLKKERVVVMHDDMNRLMRKYAMQVALAGREQSSYFFPDSELEAYTTAWLENILKTCYKNTGPKISSEHLPRVRVYDLRHRFASATLCRWLDEGKNLYNMLPYLRTYMGHSSLSQTAYYIHILPENLLKSCSIDWSKLDNIIPEDDIWDE